MKLELGVRVRIKSSAEVMQFMHGVTGMIIPPPSKHAMRERVLMRFDKDVPHPYGGVMRQAWVDETMVDVIEKSESVVLPHEC